MRYGCLFFILLAQNAYSFSWQDLWMTADQQAQQLMQQGKFRQAEKRFRQSDWQAVAAYRSGQYEKSATLFSSLNSGQGDYNQGNALARAGHYQDAIKAYDKALHVNPSDKDAQYNRKLVADLLKKEQNNKNKSDKMNDKNDKNKQGQDQQQNQQKEQEAEQQKKEQQEAKDKSSAETAPQSTAGREKQQARDQWLRLVPDEPGGLLRQKLLRDHLRRQ